MSLVKLWKSLRRRSKEHSTAEKSAAAEPSMPMPPSDVPIKKPVKKSVRKATSKRRMFGAGPHASLCRQLKGLEVGSVLEISVGDGTRALAVLETLQKQSSQPVRYAAIDEFELGGSELKLRDFYRLLREHDIRPQLFPETVDNGLRRVANNLGAMDLVLIASGGDQWKNPVTLHLLSRITHPQTLILHHEGDAWARFQPESISIGRAA